MTRYIQTLKELSKKLVGNARWLTSTRRKELEAHGFPQKDPLMNAWDWDAVKAWCDARSGIGLASSDDEYEMMRIVNET